MCMAIEEMRMDSKIEGMCEGRYEGEMKGVIETYKEFGISMQVTVRRIVDKFHISLQQSETEVKKYW